MVFVTNLEQNESYTFQEMMKQDNKTELITVMLKEIDDHEIRDHWNLMRRKYIPPECLNPTTGKADIIMSIWLLKRKHFPDVRLMKYKARLCAHGGMQRWGVNYWDTYCPVFNWISVRTLLAVAKIHRLSSQSIDFVLAFTQADLNGVNVFMQLPIGMEVEGEYGYVLKLNKSLYGLK